MPEQPAKFTTLEEELAKVNDAAMAKRRREVWKDRRAAWQAALAMRESGEFLSLVEAYSLIEDNLFEKLRPADIHEEAMNVVRYYLSGLDLSPTKPRGQAEAEHWISLGAQLDEELQTKKLQAMIEASAIDPDYWDALNEIAIQFHAQGQPFPDDLADWAIELHKGRLEAPPKWKSDHGRPHYAYDLRNKSFFDAFVFLEYLGLKSKMARYAAIAEVFEISVRTASDAIKAGRQLDRRVPHDWQCWPPPPTS